MNSDPTQITTLNKIQHHKLFCVISLNKQFMVITYNFRPFLDLTDGHLHKSALTLYSLLIHDTIYYLLGFIDSVDKHKEQHLL